MPIHAAISRASIVCHDSAALRPEQHHLVAGRHAVDAGDVDGQHVHADRADDRRAPAAHQHGAAAFEPAVEAVGVAGGHDGQRLGQRRRRGARRSRRASPVRAPFTATTRLVSVIAGVSGSVAASGGGTTP